MTVVFAQEVTCTILQRVRPNVCIQQTKYRTHTKGPVCKSRGCHMNRLNIEHIQKVLSVRVEVAI